MVQVPAFTFALVTLAALLFLLEYLAALLGWFVGHAKKAYFMRHMKRYSKRLDELHDGVLADVDMYFDLWWLEEPSKIAREAALDQLPFPEEMRDDVPEGLIEMMLESIVRHYRSVARHVAVHAVLGGKDKELVNTLPKAIGIRERALQYQAEHDERLEQERAMLAAAGINVDKLEAEFSSNK
jgi:hypothetical protein